MGSTPEHPWYEDFFDQRYLDFYPVLRQRPLASEDARSVCALLGLKPGQRVLDLGCGTGRHAVALAHEGLEVTGLDLSDALLEQARATARSERAEVRWLQRDMRDLQDLGPFDACVSLYTAFGFFGDEEDREVLLQVAAALAPGGRLLLHLTNHLGFLRRFPPEVWREDEGAIRCERSRYDPLEGVIVTERSCFDKRSGQQLVLPPSRVRAYLPHEVASMLRRAGLPIERVCAALVADPPPFDWARSPDQVFICRRP